MFTSAWIHALAPSLSSPERLREILLEAILPRLSTVKCQLNTVDGNSAAVIGEALDSVGSLMGIVSGRQEDDFVMRWLADD